MSDVPSYILDTTGVVRWVNSAASRRVGDIEGRRFTSIVAAEDRRRSRELFVHKLVGGGSATTAEFVLIDRHGTRVSVQVSSVPLVRGGRVVGVFGQITRERQAPAQPARPGLTPRQSEVLRMLEHGRSTREIASELHLSAETVRNHVRHILRAMGAHSRVEAVALARRRHHQTDAPHA